MPIIEIISNISLLIAISIVSGFIDKRWERTTRTGKLLQGALFSIVVVTGMLYPFKYSPGIIFDGRSIVISICTLFFGPVSGIITALSAAVTRLFIGGGGTLMGVMVILFSFLTGLFFHHKRDLIRINSINLYIMGGIVHVIMMALMLFLPGKQISLTFQTLGIPILLVYPLLTVLMGKILLDQKENSEYLKMLSESAERFKTTLYSIGDAVITLDKNGLITHMNPAAESLLGTTESDCEGRKGAEILSLCKSDGTLLTDSEFEYLLTYGSHHEFGMEYFIKKNEEEMIAVSESISPVVNSHGFTYGTVIVLGDQSKNRKTLEKLKESEQRLSQYIYNAPFGIFVIDETGKFISINPAGCKTLEYTEAELIGKPTVLSVLPEDHHKAENHIMNVIKEGFAYDEMRFISQKGRIGDWGITAFKLNNGTMIGYTEDITMKKKAEAEMESAIKELEDRSEQLRLAQKVSKVGSWIWHIESGELEWSDEMFDIFGIRKDEFTGQLADVIVKAIHPDDRDKVNKANTKVMMENKPVPLEYRIINDDGTEKTVYAEAGFLDPDALTGGRKLMGIVQDITERKAAEKLKDEALLALKLSEEKYRLLIENQNDMIVKVDRSGKFLFVSPSYCKMFGKSEEELVGREFIPLVHPEDKEETLEKYNEVFESPHTVYIEQRAMTVHGWKWIGWLDTAVKDENGEITSVIGVGRDIQHQKETELKLQEKMSELEKFNSFTVDRELKMIELKKEINSLLIETGRPEKYKII